MNEMAQQTQIVTQEYPIQRSRGGVRVGGSEGVEWDCVGESKKGTY